MSVPSPANEKSTMKAIGYQHAHALPDVLANNQVSDPAGSLQDITLPMPTAIGHDILVEVKAISVNPVDTKIRQHQSAQDGEWKVLGWDAVGTVKAVGDEVSLFSVGDRVWYAGDLSRSGSNAQYQLVDERITSLAPVSLSDAEAAALPLTTITAWEMLFDRLEVQRSEHIEGNKPAILIIGAAGGVGSIMVQLARQLTDLTVIGTASRPETTAWLEQLGAHHVINHRNPLSEELQTIGFDNVDYVVSLNNTDEHYSEIIKSLKPQGKFGLIDDPKNLDAMPLKLKSLSLHWELMFTRSLFQTHDMIKQHQLLSEVARLIDNGELKTTLGNNLGAINADNLRKAHQLIESQTAKGKIVLEGF